MPFSQNWASFKESRLYPRAVTTNSIVSRVLVPADGTPTLLVLADPNATGITLRNTSPTDDLLLAYANDSSLDEGFPLNRGEITSLEVGLDVWAKNLTGAGDVIVAIDKGDG